MCRSGCSAPASYSAQVAAHLGYPFAFASHFAPAMLMQALQIYRARFRPNGKPGSLTKPHAMVAVNVVCADSDDEARICSPHCSNASSACRRANAARCPPIPVAENMNALGSPAERAGMEQMLTVTAVGAPPPCAPGSIKSPNRHRPTN